jgi:hypothetical protein
LFELRCRCGHQFVVGRTEQGSQFRISNVMRGVKPSQSHARNIEQTSAASYRFGSQQLEPFELRSRRKVRPAAGVEVNPIDLNKPNAPRVT